MLWNSLFSALNSFWVLQLSVRLSGNKKMLILLSAYKRQLCVSFIAPGARTATTNNWMVLTLRHIDPQVRAVVAQGRFGDFKWRLEQWKCKGKFLFFNKDCLSVFFAPGETLNTGCWLVWLFLYWFQTGIGSGLTMASGTDCLASDWLINSCKILLNLIQKAPEGQQITAGQ